MHDTDMSLRAFSEEMDKVAIGAGLLQAARRGLQRVGGGLGAGLGIGAGAGGLGGLAYGGVKGYREAREQGAGAGEALLSGLSRGVGTGIQGAMYGAAAGGAAGGAAGAAKVLTPEHVARLSQMGKGVGTLSRFGQRQVHGLTGWTPKRGVRSIGAGAEEAVKRRAAVEAGKESPGVLRRLEGRIRGKDPAALELAAARRAEDAALKAEKMKLTSIPGYVRSMKEHGPLRTIRAGLAEQWHGSGPAGKALMVGFPAMSIGEAALGKGEPGGPGRAERIGSSLGSLAYAMGPIPIGAQTLLENVMSSGGRRLGALADRGKVEATKGYVPSMRGHLAKAPSKEEAIRGDLIGAGKGIGL